MGQMLVFTNALEGRDDDFNQWYDEVHLPEVVSLPEFTGGKRYRLSETQMFPDQKFRYLAIYEFSGSAEAAAKALSDGFGSFRMTDSMGPESHIVFVEEC